MLIFVGVPHYLCYLKKFPIGFNTLTYFKIKICKLSSNKCYHWISWLISLLSAFIGLEKKVLSHTI